MADLRKRVLACVGVEVSRYRCPCLPVVGRNGNQIGAFVSAVRSSGKNTVRAASHRRDLSHHEKELNRRRPGMREGE